VHAKSLVRNGPLTGDPVDVDMTIRHHRMTAVELYIALSSFRVAQLAWCLPRIC